MASLLVGTSLHMAEARAFCLRHGPWRKNVVFVGPTGSGKHLLAEELQRCSGRRGKMVRVAASELQPGGFVQSLLAGKVEDAYTSSLHARDGLVRAAAGSLLFFDDVQAWNRDMQPDLLDVLDRNKPLRAKGDDRSFLPPDVRFAFGTQLPLDILVRKGQLQDDLAARIGRTTFESLKLRDHREDIVQLAPHLLARTGLLEQVPPPDLTERALAALLTYDWPHNVRELEDLLWEALITAVSEGSPVIGVQHLPRVLRDLPVTRLNSRRPRVSDEAMLDALEQCGGNAARTAERLGVDRNTVFRRIKALGIPRLRRSRADMSRDIC